MLEKLRDSFRQWRESVDSLENDLEAKKQRLAYLEEAPLPATELAESVIDTLLQHGDAAFHGNLDHKLQPAINAPLADPKATQWKPSLFTRLTRPGDIDPFALFWLLREPLSQAIREEIVNWPDYPEAGPPRAKREAEMVRLQREIDDLTAAIVAQREEARQAGIELGAIGNRKTGPDGKPLKVKT